MNSSTATLASLAVNSGNAIVNGGLISDSVTVTGTNANSVTITNYAHSIQVGQLQTGVLNLATTNGTITQKSDANVIVSGITTLSATGIVTLANSTNDFGGVVNASGTAITLTDANNLTLGTIVPSGDLSVTAGQIVINSSISNPGQLQSYTGAVVSASNLTLTAANVIMSSTLTGTDTSLTITGNANIVGSVANVTALSVTQNAIFGGTIGVAGTVGSVSVTGTSALNGGQITTTGGQSFTGAATLGAATTLASTGSGNVTFTGTVNGSNTLTVNTAGTTRFNSAVGGITPLSSLTTDSGGTTQINDVTTVGAQNYNDSVVLLADTVLTTNNSDIHIGGTLNGAFNLGITAGTGNVSFGGNVGNTAVLNTVTFNSVNQINATGSFQSTNLNLNAGTLNANTAFTTALKIDIGSTFNLQSAGSLTGSVNLVSGTVNSDGRINGMLVVESGTATLSSTSNVTGATILNQGTLTNSGLLNTFTLNGGTASMASGASVTGATTQTAGTLNVLSGGQIASLVASGGTTNVNTNSTVTGSANITTGGTLNGNGTFGSLIVSGGTATLTGATVSGSTSVTGGTLGTDNSSATTLSGTLSATGGTTTLNKVSVGGLVTVDGGTVLLSSSTTAINAGLNLISGTVTGTAGTITNSGVGSAITTSDGTMSLRGMTINGAANTTAIQINGGSVDLGNATQNGLNTITSAGASGLLIYNNAAANMTAIGDVMNGVTTATASTADLYATVNKIVDGVDQSGLGLVQIKVGYLYVTDTSFVSPGTTPSVQRAVNLSTVGDTIWVQSGGATFSGGLSIAGGQNLTIRTGITDDALVTTALTGNMSLTPGSTLKLNVSNATASHYTISSSTSVNLNNATLDLSNLGNLTIGNVYTILDLANGVSLNGRFANATGNSTYYNFGTTRGRLIYNAGPDSNDVNLQIIPPTDPTNVLVNAQYANDTSLQREEFNGANYYYGWDAFSNLTAGFDTVAAGTTVYLFNGTYTGATADRTFALQVPVGQSATVTTPINTTAPMDFTNWTGNLLASQINVASGSNLTGTNLAQFISSDGTLQFASGATFSNVALSATRNISITSSSSTAAVLVGTGSTPVITVSSEAANATLTSLSLNSSSAGGVGVDLSNTNSVAFNYVSMGSNISSAGNISSAAPITLTFNYLNSTANNSLGVASSPNRITFTQFNNESANLLLTGGTANVTLNAVLGNGSFGGVNGFGVATNTTLAGGAITTGSGNDSFNLGSYFPGTISGGAGTNTLTLSDNAAGIYQFNGGGSGVVVAPSSRANNFTLTGSSLGTLNTTNLTSFNGVSGLTGGIYADTFTFADGAIFAGTIDGGIRSGVDTINMNAYASDRILQFNLTGAGSGNVNLMQPGNVTGSVTVMGSYINIESLSGGQGADIFHFGNTGTIAGINGFNGNNTLDYRDYTPAGNSTTGATVDLNTHKVTSVTNLANNIRDIFGTSVNDSLTGDDQSNILYGGNGTDSLIGNGGNDLIIGGYGADQLSGGAGYDLLIGGYVDFTNGRGNANTAYGIPAANVDYVLRAMMDQQLFSVTSNTTADSAFDVLQGVNGQTGISVIVPGNSTTFANVILASNGTTSIANSTTLANSTTYTGVSVGTVFNDNLRDTITVASSGNSWIFYSASTSLPPSATADLVQWGTGPRRKTIANRLNP